MKRPARRTTCVPIARTTGINCSVIWHLWLYPTGRTTAWYVVWTTTHAPFLRFSRSRKVGQSTILGGGRYDALVEQIGGRPTPGIGFAAGMERLVLNLKRQEVNVPDEPKPEYLVASIGEGARDAAFHIAFKMRQSGARAILSSGSRSLRGQLRQANALGVHYVVIVGEDELEREQVSLRDMVQGGQEVKPMAQFFEDLDITSSAF